MMTDLLRLLSALSVGRIINLLRNEFSYYLSRVIKRPVMCGLPWAISIEPTTSCNLSCPECPSGLKKFTRPTGSMSLDSFVKTIDQISPHLIYLTLYFQGEPMLNRNFIDMVKYAKKKRIYVASSTNGHFLDDVTARSIVESGLDRLIISIDGTDQSSYEKYRRGGSITKVQDGIANLIRWKKELGAKHPFIELQFLVLRTNQHQITGIKHYAGSLQVNKLSLKTAQLYQLNDNPFLTSLKAFSRYDHTSDGQLTIRNKLPDHCHRMWHAPVITWDGRLLPCCFDKDAANTMGILSEDSFSVLWRNGLYRKFRSNVFSERCKIEICRNCSEGL